MTYRVLFAVPGFRRLAGATVLARTGTTMQSLILVLFVLQRYHSPALAGLVVFLSLVPGIVVSPLAGALLDRHRRMLLINADYGLAALSLTTIALLSSVGDLPVAALLVVVSVSSLTNPLSNSGTRSLFPVLVPRGLWARANAVDSGAYVVAAIAGPAVAGLLIGLVGPQPALLATACLFVAGLVLLLGMTEPELARAAPGSLVHDALAGLGYVVRQRELRGLAVTTAVSNVAFGIISVGMPVLLLTRFHSGSGTVGAMYAVMGVAGLVSGALAGRMDSVGREAWFVLVGCVVATLSMVAMFVAAAAGGGVAVVAIAMCLFGIANGPFDIGLFSLRQRVTAPAWMGRAFAVSMSLNFIGMPIGSALAGPVVEHSIPAAFMVAIAVDVLAGVAVLTLVRPRRPRQRRGTRGERPGDAGTPAPTALRDAAERGVASGRGR